MEQLKQRLTSGPRKKAQIKRVSDQYDESCELEFEGKRYKDWPALVNELFWQRNDWKSGYELTEQAMRHNAEGVGIAEEGLKIISDGNHRPSLIAAETLGKLRRHFSV